MSRTEYRTPATRVWAVCRASPLDNVHRLISAYDR
jgi:hypothetical protein